ncbi:metal-dependent phosphohydrolase [Bacillus manliponensis]|uniref:Metal-dependent phosphohydrolase n=1 Tax=Bacillus manliponensis TaxID=574376 RepID=A0A073JZN9_9BACI|nr:HD domain-containing protein [Bacillus manliponensis]KEK19751.1 metal-dependent phosphohydrolase [Bacillus manliponensis]
MKITDAIYGTITIEDEEVKALIKTKAFQRLSLIKQQGHTYFLHPNAVHTRIEHSIGVYHLMDKVITHLMEKQDITISPYERKVAMIATILHDIGHGPFSHCFQKVCQQDHGDLTIRIIRENLEIRSILEKIPNLLEDVVNVLQGEGKFQLIEDIMFSSLGVDQLDFWNRDLHYSSLSLELVPIDKLISTIRYINKQLIIEETGIPFIEHLVHIKQHLYHEGFGHPFVIGKDLLFQEIFREARESDTAFVNPVLCNFFMEEDVNIQIEDFLQLHDEMIHDEIKQFASRNNGRLSYLAALYLQSEHSLKWGEGFKKIEGMHIVHKVTEKKNYSSYTGGIFIKKDTFIEDIKHLSVYIQNIVDIPAKEYICYLEENLIENK